jgi:dipeptidyl aminopeptidase/acylaminoacyl peptidase
MSIERKIWWVLLAVSLTSPASLQAAQVTVDDLMRLSTVSDVRISPDGNQVAYVVSTPSLETASHEAVLYRIPAAGGTSLRLTYNTRIFNKPLPSPWLRWSPDGSLLSFVAYVGDVPQVMAMYSTGGEPWVLTSPKEGVTRFEHGYQVYSTIYFVFQGQTKICPAYVAFVNGQKIGRWGR